MDIEDYERDEAEKKLLEKLHEAFLKENKPDESQKGAERKEEILNKLVANLTMPQTKLMEELELTRVFGK